MTMQNNHKIKTPLHKVIYGKENLDTSSREIFESMLFPLVVKPLKGGSSMGVFVVKDSNGNILNEGDDIILIKDLPLKGSSITLKKGSKSKNIRLVEGDHEIDCKVDGMKVMLKACFVKKA